ncbi:MAG: PaaI family thioesterase [Polyangiales bacterium]
MSRLDAAVHDARASGDYDRLLNELPYARFLGLTAQLRGDVVVVRLPFRPLVIGNVRQNALHGGVVGACLECAGLLQLIHARGLPLPKTIDFTVDYLRLARDQELCAEAEVQRLGRRVANVRMRAYQQGGDEPVALGRGNFLLG